MKEKGTVLNTIIRIGIPLISAAVLIAFTVLCVPKFKSGFIFDHATVILYTALAIEIAYVITTAVFFFLKIEIVYKFLLTGLVLGAAAIIGLFILQETGIWEKIDSRDALREMIRSTGVWGPLAFIVLQSLQVFLLPIPGVLTVGAGVLVFGAPLACIYSYIGIVGGSLIAFWIGKSVGYRAAAWLVGKDSLDQWQNKLKGKDRRLLTVMFLLPMFPDDILCFVSGLSKMGWKYFIVMQMITRMFSVVLTSFSLDGMIIPYDTWWGILSWIVIGVAILALFVLIYKKGDKIEEWFLKLFKRNKKTADQSADNLDFDTNKMNAESSSAVSDACVLQAKPVDTKNGNEANNQN